MSEINDKIIITNEDEKPSDRILDMYYKTLQDILNAPSSGVKIQIMSRIYDDRN